MLSNWFRDQGMAVLVHDQIPSAVGVGGQQLPEIRSSRVARNRSISSTGVWGIHKPACIKFSVGRVKWSCCHVQPVLSGVGDGRGWITESIENTIIWGWEWNHIGWACAVSEIKIQCLTVQDLDIYLDLVCVLSVIILYSEPRVWMICLIFNNIINGLRSWHF